MNIYRNRNFLGISHHDLRCRVPLYHGQRSALMLYQGKNEKVGQLLFMESMVWCVVLWLSRIIIAIGNVMHRHILNTLDIRAGRAYLSRDYNVFTNLSSLSTP